MRISSLAILTLLLISVFGCGTRNLTRGELPKSDQGVAFARVRLSDISNVNIHLFGKGDRIGPHKARIDAVAGDAIYAVALSEGAYDIGQISSSAGLAGTDLQRNDDSPCPAFEIRRGYSSFIGEIYMLVKYPKYQIKCVNSDQALQKSEAQYKDTYPGLYEKFPIKR